MFKETSSIKKAEAFVFEEFENIKSGKTLISELFLEAFS